ncbi:MAG: TolC family protein [Bacteroidales bacterium]|nr:TolC family protein [Bacteroidales bacterium]
MKRIPSHLLRGALPLVLALLLTPRMEAQQLDYATFIGRVMQGNLDYAAARLDLSMSQADLTAARRISDPSLSVEYGNNSDWDIAMGRSLSFGLGKSISLGKRVARVDAARHQLDATDAGLQHFVQTLRAEATLAYIDALLARDLSLIGQQALQHIQALYHSDSLRHAAGELSEIDVVQTRLEARLAQQDYDALLVEYANALVQLDLLMGGDLGSTHAVQGEMTAPTRLFDLQRLLEGADTLRMDLVQQHHLALSAESDLTLLRRERMPDLDLSLGVSLNSRVRNEEAPAPEFVGYTVGVGIPLPVSNLNRGEVRAGQYRVQQARLQDTLSRRQARSEIMQAYNSYQSSLRRLASYNTLIMDNARQVLDGKMYAYQRGETSLLDVISAQHTYNEIRQAYAECLHDCLSAWVELERSAGLWDISL